MLNARNKSLYEEAKRRGRKDDRQIKLCGGVLSLAAAIEADCARRLARHQLSESKFVMLIVLHDSKGGLAPNELATRCGVTRATMTSLIDGLERDGITRRTADGQDRRSVNIQLTDKGADLARSVFDEHAEWLGSVFGGLDQEQSEVLASLIELIWQKTDAGKLAAAAATPDDELA
ncbi:MAG: MarR family transcriptional regulator [Rhizobium sp.]|nr:MarR family transcriptional regulator [Rhizobium sp.]